MLKDTGRYTFLSLLLLLTAGLVLDHLASLTFFILCMFGGGVITAITTKYGKIVQRWLRLDFFTAYDEKFFERHLGTNEFYNTQTGKVWHLSFQMQRLQKAVDYNLWLKLRANIGRKCRDYAARRKAYKLYYSDMSPNQRVEAEKAMKDQKLDIAVEIVELVKHHTVVTEATMDYITGKHKQWYSQEVKHEFEVMGRVFNPPTMNQLPPGTLPNASRIDGKR